MGSYPIPFTDPPIQTVGAFEESPELRASLKAWLGKLKSGDFFVASP